MTGQFRSGQLGGLRIGLLERAHAPDHAGALTDSLVPRLQAAGAQVTLVHAEQGLHRLDRRPPWDLTILKSGTAGALHLAAAAEAWGIPCLNTAETTRCAQDKLATAALLQRAGLPIAPSASLWLDGTVQPVPVVLPAYLDGVPLIIKAARGSRGEGQWRVPAGGLASLAETLPAGPYLVMEHVPHHGDDLKVYAVGAWQTALRRPFPALTLEQKRGRPVPVPADVSATTEQVGSLLGLRCYGCDFVAGPTGWVLVDVNAFPGYKGAVGAAEAIVNEIVSNKTVSRDVASAVAVAHAVLG